MTPTKEDFDLVHSIVKEAKSSFYWGMRLLPVPQREAMFALYALARHLDDIADGDEDAISKKAALTYWHEEIDRLYEGEQTEPLARALLPAVLTFSLDKEELHKLIQGMEMDADGPVHAPDHETLMKYCRRVAGTVGLLSVTIFKRRDSEAKEFAIALANALQLTNILRDINEDAAIDRLYVSKDLLDKHNIPITTPLKTISTPGFEKVFNDLANEAEYWFSKVDELLKSTSPKGLRPAITMMAVYRQLFEKLRQKGWQIGAPKFKLSKREQAWAILRQYMVQP
ncbi:MAG: presqualene diphosphate synthase HpnD [Rhodospirillales bacterium]|nr:presqualene diphosphate synthase HpnD [Rhodospirillales bacterium]